MCPTKSTFNPAASDPLRRAAASFNQGVGRVAVFDFDVHHGNGTEAVLKDQPHTAFFSIHQHPWYPGTGAENAGDNCFNFPVPARLPRDDYRGVMETALGRLRDFGPELLAVSAGFDCYARDPLGQMTFREEDFNWLGRKIRGLGIPTFSVLEGGYSKDLPNLILAYLTGLEEK